MAHDIFLSHSTKDKVTADAICAGLEANGIRCWVAPRDIKPGQNWGEAIVGGINGCKVMVIVFSSHSNQSDHVLREIERAVNNGSVLIPFRIEDVEPSAKMEYFLSVPHWLDAMTKPLENHIAALTKTVKSIVSNKVDGESVHDQPEPIPAARQLLLPKKKLLIGLALVCCLVMVVGLFAFLRSVGDTPGERASTAKKTAEEPSQPIVGNNPPPVTPNEAKESSETTPEVQKLAALAARELVIGQTYYKNAEWDKAIRHLNYARNANLKPSRVIVLYLLGLTYNAKGNHTTSPEERRSLFELAGDFLAQAIKLEEKKEKLDQEFLGEAYYNRACILTDDLDKHEEALRDFARSSELNYDSYAVDLGIARAKTRLDK